MSKTHVLNKKTLNFRHNVKLGPFISNFFEETKPIFIFQNWTSMKYQKDFSIPQDPHSKLIKITFHTQIQNICLLL